jgi:two-component system chemotaxis response regulator CheY
MRAIIKRSLNAIGITHIVEAQDGVAALEAFQPDRFDLILTDWNMPRKTGVELARDLRAQQCTLPILMITTEAEKPRVVEAIQAGVSDYLVKPFTPDELQAKLERYRLDA